MGVKGNSGRATGVVVACAVGNMLGATPMVFTVFGLFLVPVATEFGWPRASVSLVLLIVSVAGLVSFPVVGRIIDRYGARWVMLLGTLLFAVAVALAGSTGPSRFQFYLAYTFIGVAGAIPSNVMFTKVIANWFVERRGFALGIAGGLGNGIGAALSPLLAHYLISEYGWRDAYRGLGLTIALVALPVLFFMLHDPPQRRSVSQPSERSAPAHVSSASASIHWGLTFAEALRSSPFWLILAAIGVGAGCMTAVLAHVVPMLTDRGLATARATSVLVTFSIITALWQIGVGYSLDRIARPWIATPFFLVAVIGLWILDTATSYPVLILAGALMGLGLGTEFAILPYFISRYFGVAHYGVISGTVYGVVLLIQGLSPYLMGLAYDAQGSYGGAVTLIGFGLIFSALLILRLPRFPALRAE